MIVFLTPTSVRADWLCVHTQSDLPNGITGDTEIRECYVSLDAAKIQRFAQRDGQVILVGLHRHWQAIRADVTRGAVEAALTMFFIKTGPPPKVNDPGPKITPPPPGGNGDPPPPPPPPPDGQGEPGPTDPPVDPPFHSPEPASLVTALCGVGLVSTYVWRRRRARAAHR
jgi:hypothetical protein